MPVTKNTVTPKTRRLTLRRCPLEKMMVKKKVSPTIPRKRPLEMAIAMGWNAGTTVR